MRKVTKRLYVSSISHNQVIRHYADISEMNIRQNTAWNDLSKMNGKFQNSQAS